LPDSLIDKSLAIFDGEVQETEIEEEDNTNLWKVKVQNTDGSVLDIYWTVDTENLYKLEGVQGPYDYAVNPGMGLITFGSAKTIAISAVKNDNLIDWELKQNDDFVEKWVYEFDIDDEGVTTTVYVDAENGDVLQID